MTFITRLLILSTGLFLASCANSKRTAFTPESGPPTVGMPSELNERERLFVPDIEAALRDNGLLPVRHGAGEMELEFTMSAGPINTDTNITLAEGRRTVASGTGRAAGVPLIGRSSVAEKSFERAFQDFQKELRAAKDRRGWSASTTSSAPPALPSLPPVY